MRLRLRGVVFYSILGRVEAIKCGVIQIITDWLLVPHRVLQILFLKFFRVVEHSSFILFSVLLLLIWLCS